MQKPPVCFVDNSHRIRIAFHRTFGRICLIAGIYNLDTKQSTTTGNYLLEAAPSV